MNRRIKLAAYLAHTRRADGSWVADWTVARLAVAEVRQVLRKHLTNIRLPQDLTEAAHAASVQLYFVLKYGTYLAQRLASQPNGCLMLEPLACY